MNLEKAKQLFNKIDSETARLAALESELTTFRVITDSGEFRIFLVKDQSFADLKIRQAIGPADYAK